MFFSNPYGRDDARMNRICHGGYAFRVDCFTPAPSTTAGESVEIARLAAENTWKRVIIVTFVPHASRARYIVQKCYPGELTVVANRPDLSPLLWAYNYVYQSAGYARTLVTRC